jgi:perosamine synthetase
VDLAPLIKICQEREITLIEDCAHAAGSYYKDKHVGTFGDFGCFSFAAIKNLTTGDGGMLVGKSRYKIEHARALAWSGISQSTWQRAKGKKLKWQYNVIDIGWKYQINDIAAAIGLVQLEKLKSNNLKRKKIAEIYNKAFSDISWIETPVIRTYAKSSYHNYVIKVPAKIRDKLSSYLAKHGIITTVHYMPSHYYDLYAEFPHDVPVTERVWRKILLLPIFPDLSIKDQEFIIDKIKKFKP